MNMNDWSLATPSIYFTRITKRCRAILMTLIAIPFPLNVCASSSRRYRWNGEGDNASNGNEISRVDSMIMILAERHSGFLDTISQCYSHMYTSLSRLFSKSTKMPHVHGVRSLVHFYFRFTGRFSDVFVLSSISSPSISFAVMFSCNDIRRWHDSGIFYQRRHVR